MNITKKHQYGLLSMIQLGLHYQQGPIQLKTISEQASIPHSFLEQLVLDLKRKQLVVSTRGSKGGYQLATAPSNITVFDIFSAFGDVSVASDSIESLSYFWDQLSHHMNQFFDVKLSVLINDVLKQEKVLLYSI